MSAKIQCLSRDLLEPTATATLSGTAVSKSGKVGLLFHFREIGLLNWAARYYPILRVLDQHGLSSKGSILEIGSGSTGLGTFRKIPFTGCDICFPNPPQWPMTPVIASATDLPFADGSFDAVLVSDVLEHIPPEFRERVIQEALRTARQLVIFGFPSGAAAHQSDRALRELFLSKHLEVPGWLEEHMLAPFPEENLFTTLPGWKVTRFGNENIHFHAWVMRREIHRSFVRASNAIRRLAPWLLRALLTGMERPPFYRQIFVLVRES